MNKDTLKGGDLLNENGLLYSINSPEDLKKLTVDQMNILAGQIRELLIQTISQNGGHLASNLGVVELTIALHKIFNTPNDQIVWDVGHQCYTHKILTGRRDRLNTLRQEGGLAGFPKPCESPYDSFVAGHSSTSISAALGLAKAKTLQGKNDFTIAVIGDGSLTGGMAYEALNNAGRSRDRLIVILNDNKMSISRNVGAIARHLAVRRSKPGYFRFKNHVERTLARIPKIGHKLSRGIIKTKAVIKNVLYNNTLFENMGFAYLGPVDGHNLKQLCEVLESCKTVKRPVVLHVCTVKGKGYTFAENDPKHYHGISPFNILTGDDEAHADGFSEVFGHELCSLAQKDDTICAISAAMVPGTGLAEFEKQFGNRLFDVGIAEAHAATFAAGLAANGMKPVFAVYSSFSQRCFDQIIHDVAIQKLNVVFGIDRAGFVGEDGETHQGLFDAAFLNTVPNITVLCPAYFDEMRHMLKMAFYDIAGPVCLRYPRGGEGAKPKNYKYDNKPYTVYGNKNAKNVLVTYGRIFSNACVAVDRANADGLDVCVLKINRIKPIDEQAILLAKNKANVIFMEEGVGQGGIGEHFCYMLNQQGFNGRFMLNAVSDEFVAQGKVNNVLKRYKLDEDGMHDILTKTCRNE